MAEFDPLQFLRNLKSIAVATSENNEPSVRIIDLMIYEDGKLYFVTGRGKPFYRQLKKNPRIALVGMDENYVTVRGLRVILSSLTAGMLTGYLSLIPG